MHTHQPLLLIHIDSSSYTSPPASITHWTYLYGQTSIALHSSVSAGVSTSYASRAPHPRTSMASDGSPPWRPLLHCTWLTTSRLASYVSIIKHHPRSVKYRAITRHITPLPAQTSRPTEAVASSVYPAALSSLGRLCGTNTYEQNSQTPFRIDFNFFTLHSWPSVETAHARNSLSKLSSPLA